MGKGDHGINSITYIIVNHQKRNLCISIKISDKIYYIANQWKRKRESFYLFSIKPAIWQITADEMAKHSI